MERILTCIVCPRGCTLHITLEDGKVKSVTGNACKRGVSYAEDECTHPKRTVTSTVRCDGGGLVAVKTSKAIPKELVFDCMKAINSLRAPKGTKVGDVILSNVLDTGADIVATSELL